MSYDYAAAGYQDLVFIWEGTWNKDHVKLYIWRKQDPDQSETWMYVFDLRDKYNETLGLRQNAINHLMIEILYSITSREVVTKKKPTKKDRFSLLFGDNK